jgi:hypothetical protein
VNSYELDADTYVNALAARGHRRISAAERMRLLDELERSALTLKAFAAQNGINYYTLVGWRQARRKQSGLERCHDHADCDHGTNDRADYDHDPNGSSSGGLAADDNADCDHGKNDRTDCDHGTNDRAADELVAVDQNVRLKPAVAATASLTPAKPTRFHEVQLDEPPQPLADKPLPPPARDLSQATQPPLGIARPATPSRNPAPTPLEVTLRGGAVVRSADVAQLAELLQLLGN